MEDKIPRVPSLIRVTFSLERKINEKVQEVYNCLGCVGHDRHCRNSIAEAQRL